MPIVNPMLATEMDIDHLTSDQWAWEGKWDGVRIIARNDTDDGRWHLQTRSGRTVTEEYRLVLPDLPPVVLDGEAVVLDGGVPSFNAIQNRAVAKSVEYFTFDVLEVQGNSLESRGYEDRRTILDTLGNYGLMVPPVLDFPTGAHAMDWAQANNQEGIIAKKRGSPYVQGKRSRTWLKSKVWRTADVVVGGWTEGSGRRSGSVGNVLMGLPTDSGLVYCGAVGTGFTDAELERLLALFRSLASDECPFTVKEGFRNPNWVRPVLTAEVRYQLMTGAGILRLPSWRGIRSGM